MSRTRIRSVQAASCFLRPRRWQLGDPNSPHPRHSHASTIDIARNWPFATFRLKLILWKGCDVFQSNFCLLVCELRSCHFFHWLPQSVLAAVWQSVSATATFSATVSTAAVPEPAVPTATVSAATVSAATVSATAVPEPVRIQPCCKWSG